MRINFIIDGDNRLIDDDNNRVWVVVIGFGGGREKACLCLYGGSYGFKSITNPDPVPNEIIGQMITVT